MGRSFSHFSFSQPIFLENVLLLLVSCHNGWSFFSYGLFFISLSHSRFLLFHQTLFCLVLNWMCILYVYLIHSCWSFLFLSIYFALIVVAFTFFLFRIPVDNVKRTNCVRTRSPFRCLTFDYTIYMFSSFVPQSIGNGIIIPFSITLAILMCVFFSSSLLCVIKERHFGVAWI